MNKAGNGKRSVCVISRQIASDLIGAWILFQMRWRVTGGFDKDNNLI